MALIFSLSSQNAETSSQTSGSVIESFVRFFYPGFQDMPAGEQETLVASFQFITRKTAHFSLYAFLGVLSFLCFISYRNLKYSIRVLLSAAVCLMYAASDEIHQLFVPGRSGEIRDVCIDFFGAMLAITVLVLCSRYIKRIYSHIKAV